MPYGRIPILRYAVPIALVGLGAVLFLPGDQTTITAGSAMLEQSAPDRPSYLMASPELIAELDTALQSAPSLVGETMAREAMLPDPSASTTAAVAATPAITANATDPTTIDPTKAARVVTAVNMRAGPSKSTARLTTLQPDQALILGETSNGWVQVTTSDGVSGWVYSRYVSGAGVQGGDDSMPAAQTVAAREPEQEEEPQRFSRHARISDDVVVRASPSRGGERLFILPAGERVGIAEVDGRWARVVLRSGASGWVMIR